MNSECTYCAMGAEDLCRCPEPVSAAREAKPTLVTATGVSADPGGTETKPEQNLHEKGSEG